MKPLVPYSEIINQVGLTNKEKFDAELDKVGKKPNIPTKIADKKPSGMSAANMIDYIKGAQSYTADTQSKK